MEHSKLGSALTERNFFQGGGGGLVVLVAQWVRHWLAGPVILGLIECGKSFQT